MKSVRDQQTNTIITNIAVQDASEGVMPNLYNSEQLLIKLAHVHAEINRVISAMREGIKGEQLG